MLCCDQRNPCIHKRLLRIQDVERCSLPDPRFVPDAVERGTDEKKGGRRDPLNRWDFYDVNGDGKVDSRDALAVTDALGTKVGNGKYDPALDRSAPAKGAPAWEAGPPDGVIDATDFFLVTAQLGTSCVQALAP